MCAVFSIKDDVSVITGLRLLNLSGYTNGHLVIWNLAFSDRSASDWYGGANFFLSDLCDLLCLNFYEFDNLNYE